MKFPYDFTALRPPLLEQTTNDCELQSLKNDGWNPGPFEVIECFSLTTGVRIHAQNLSSVLWHGTVMYMSLTHTHMHCEPAKSPCEKASSLGQATILEP